MLPNDWTYCFQNTVDDNRLLSYSTIRNVIVGFSKTWLRDFLIHVVTCYMDSGWR